ncbi:kinase-like domain-containing protein [Rhizophagus clarus]|uniref:Kinase-like domain-containing protein n=1 Tax=Rhizophagus clarus TaxID=94130 RepID=A0A8H3LGJ6_9GLOM|nr:kinase-like domain-containing protein [Rhizophagus clarus]
MENTKEISFDSTPKLKSSPIPILFLPFNNDKLKCINCGSVYSATYLYKQKYCKKCLLSYVEDIADNDIYFDYCRLCGKLIDENSMVFKMCSNCYLISSGWTKSNFTNKSVPILYLPWWDASNKIYVGCRYCLTTNIIFGITDQTLCKKCKRISNIDINITNISSGNHNINEFLFSTRANTDTYDEIANYSNDMKKTFDPLNVYGFIEYCGLQNVSSKRTMEWIPYSQISNLKKIAEGGFGVIYKAIWLNKTPIAVKRFLNSQVISKNFLNEVKSLHKLKTIHNENFIHRDFHSGNILSLRDGHKKWVIGDLGLSQPANDSSNNEIYGVIPYIAPEIFKGAAFSKESDIYSMGMVMWELTTGCKPFSKVEHDIGLILKIIDGKRPEITIDTPECFAILMKSCWNTDPLKRPSITEIKETVDKWYYICKENYGIFVRAEIERSKLVYSNRIGLESNKKQHPGVVYTSRSLSSFISQVSSLNSSTISEQDNTKSNSKLESAIFNPSTSSSINSSSDNSVYISNDLDFDIDTDTQRSSKVEINPHPNIFYTSIPLSALISDVKELL